MSLTLCKAEGKSLTLLKAEGKSMPVFPARLFKAERNSRNIIPNRRKEINSTERAVSLL